MAFALITCGVVYYTNENNAYAVSDNDNDQAVKLKVRDAILKNVGDRLSKTDKNECRDEIINDLNEFEDIANDVLRENGFSYTAHAEYGKFEFPEKTYKSMVFRRANITA